MTLKHIVALYPLDGAFVAGKPRQSADGYCNQEHHSLYVDEAGYGSPEALVVSHTKLSTFLGLLYTINSSLVYGNTPSILL